MDAKVVYWTGALAVMLAIVTLACAGVREARRGRIARHRRCMALAGSLLALFLASYVVKVAWLGREQLARWSPGDVLVLRIHETCIAVMLAAGLFAAQRTFRLWRADGSALEAAAGAPALRGHRRAGWIALCAALAGLVTAALVLSGMYARLA
jgi:uncharacterized membrane protein YozB (DUF420 family)